MASDESGSVPAERLITDGYARFNAGDRAGARELLQRVPRGHRLAIESQRLLGVIAYAEGDFRESARQFERVIKHGQPRPIDHANMGLALTGLGKYPRAERQIRAALADDPALVEGWFNLGNLYLRTEKFEPAARAYAKMIEIAPTDPRAHFNRGIALARWHRPEDAIKCFARTLEINPGFINARNEMGLGLAALGDQDGAEKCYRQVLEADPGHQAALANLGNALAARRRFDEALGCLDQAYKCPVANVEVTVSYAEVLLRVGRTREAEAVFRRALELAPENGRSLAALAMIYQWQCRWEELEAVQAKLHPLALRDAAEDRRSPIAPHTALSQYFTPAEERLVSESWSRDLTRDMAALQQDGAFSYPPRNRERIRLGYFSNDFNSQATAHLIVGLFEHHDRDRFEIYAYSFGEDDGSVWRRRIEAASDQFADVTHDNYADTAARMNRDEVDILLDFKGFTAEARPQVYALRPAPIQVNYLGFPGTIGADWMDYLVADEIVIPPEERTHYTEQIVYLPESYQANDDRQPIGDWPATRADMGLPDGVIVFSCFNETYKIDRTIFGVWMRILDHVPGSVLWLRDHSEELQTNLRAAAEGAGMSPDRLYFADSLPKEQHLARCRLADLFLDSYALTAHTTATDSLWAGVPVLTCPRNTFATRVGRSLLQNVGLPELAVDSLEEYEALAIRLATQPEELRALRDRLQRNLETEPLFDTQRLTRHLEAAFTGMWDRYLDGGKPESFRVEPINGAGRRG
jgi:protein O-GlcNAc transferase